MARPRASVNTNVSTITDGLTGEVLAQTVTQEVISQGIPDSEPDFIKLYLNRIAKIQGLNNSQSSVLFEIAKQMPWASETDQYIILNSFAKDKIAQRLGVKQQYIKDTISKLAKEGMLIREGSARSAAYRINPLYIAKGNWADIKKLQLKVTFNAQHGEVIEGVEVEKMDGTIETIEASKKEAAATKPPKKNTEPTPEELEAKGQTTIFNEQAATTTEPAAEEEMLRAVLLKQRRILSTVDNQEIAETICRPKICSVCSKPMVIRNSKASGDFWGCSGYPNCRHTESI